jgi:hypothetical protein
MAANGGEFLVTAPTLSSGKGWATRRSSMEGLGEVVSDEESTELWRFQGRMESWRRTARGIARWRTGTARASDPAVLLNTVELVQRIIDV